MEYLNILKDEYISKKQLLSSLVLNPPYRDSYLDTSPKIAKVHSLPFGVRIDSNVLCRLIFSTLIMSSIFMTIVCLFTFCISLPIQAQNTQLINKARSVSNNKLNVIVKLQEVTSNSRLFTGASLFSMKEPEEVIRVELNMTLAQREQKFTRFNKYPSIQFAGF